MLRALSLPLAAGALLAMCAAAAADMLVTAPQFPPAQAVDWRFAPQVGGFRVVGSGLLAVHQASAQVAYDAQALHVLFRVPVPGPGRPKGEKRPRDGAVWQDDAVELLLDPGNTRTHFFHLIVSCVGSVYDARDGDPAWNGKWTGEVQAPTSSGARSGDLSYPTVGGLSHEWTCRIRVPFSALGREAPKPGEEWGINFCADYAGDEPTEWAFTGRRFEEPTRFGTLLFQPEAPAVKLPELRDLVVGAQALQLSVASRSGAHVRLAAKLGNAAATPLDESRLLDLAAGEVRPVRFPFEARPEAEYTASVSATAGDGKLLFAMECPVVIRPPVVVRVRPFFFERTAEVTVDATVLPQPAEGMKAEVSAFEPGNLPVDRRTVALARKEGTVEVQMGDGVGPVRVRVTVLDAQGVVVGRGEALVERPATPAWVGTKAGLSDQVLPPFEPIRAVRDELRLWGRSLRLRGGLLPTSIISRGAELLAAPIALVLQTDGKPQAVSIPAKITRMQPQVAAWAGETTAGSLAVAGRASLDYDGCMKVEVELTPHQATQVRELTLELPLRAQVARYLHACALSWDETQSRAIPAAGWKHGFVPYLWVGDEDRGLAWFMESDEAFHNADPKAALEITPRGEQAVVRVRIIDTPTRLEGPLRLEFGLQPTPVKPVPPRKERLWHGAHYGVETETVCGSGSLQYPAKDCLDLHQGALAIVATLDFDPAETNRQRNNQTLFHLRQANNDQVFLFWDYDGMGLWFYLGLGPGYPQQYPIHITANQLGWKKGETHHIALNWGSRTVLYADGREVAVSADHPGWMATPLTTEEMSFGSSAPGDPAAWTLHSVRVDSAPRDPQDFAREAALVRQQGREARLPGGELTTLLHHPRPGPDGKLTAPQVGPRPKLTGEARALADGVRFTSGEVTSALDLLRERGVEVVVYHDTWTQWYGYPSTIYGDKLRSLIKACHDRKMKLILYFGYGLANATPEMKLYHDEWAVWPLVPWTGGGPERTFDAGCNRSALADFILDGLARLADEYDIDGVYLDGTTEPFGCTNHHHGCGYLRDGVWHKTYPIWSNRDMIRRLCTIFVQRRKEPLVDVHMSANLTIPTLAFCNSYWDGEQFEGYVHGKQDPGALLRLDSFRAEFMGRQFGLEPEFLVYEGRPFTTDEALAMTMLHDVLVRPLDLGDSLTRISAIWKARDEFGVEKAQFLPYWNNCGPLKPGPAGVYVSGYQRPDGDLLLVVSNLGKSAVAATVQVEAAQEGWKAWDALTRETVRLTGKTLQTELEPMGWKLIRVGR